MTNTGPSSTASLNSVHAGPWQNISKSTIANTTKGSAMAEGPHDALVSRNSATTKYPYRVELFA